MAQANPPGVLAPFKGQRQLHPGIRVQVGQHVVTVKRFLSQGGFAHVYLVQADRPVRLPSGEQTTSLVLKHMCVWNKDALRSVRAEVEHHRELHGHTSIVHFVEASAANLQGDGWEIFILMECCAGGGLIDFLNTRLQNRLTEKEVLTIFRDVCRGVQVMHAKQLVHRDLKIENILLSQSDPPQFKLCDFGSCFSARGIRPAVTPEDKKRLEAELNMHTTIWYRAPEMVDLRLEQLIDQRADVWALGVLLYKLCYYTTPFEGPHGGPTAILQARYTMPPTPPYSQDLKALIGTSSADTASMLTVDPAHRPSVSAILDRVEQLLGPTSARRTTASRPAGPSSARASPVPRPTSAAAKPSDSWPSKRPSPIHRPLSDTHAPNDSRPSATPDPAESVTESVDTASERFPSLEELNSRAAVRKLAANYNKSEQPLAYKPRAKPQRSHLSMPETAPSPQRTPSFQRKPVQSQADHTALDVHSSDEDEAPEDAGPNPLFRVRARDSVAIDMEPSVRDELASINTASSARQERAPVRSLSELLAEESARNTGDTSATAEPPKQDELASLAEHEKALEALLQPGPTTEEPESVEGPVVGDLLGIEGLSVSSRASAWEKGRECNDKASEASKPGRPSAPMADPPASEHTSPDLAAVESQPETQSGSAEAAAPSEHPSDVETRTDMPASEEKPSDTRGGSRRPSHDSAGSLDRTRSVAAAKPPAPKPGTKPSALPPPSRARPAQNKPIKVAPAREPSSPRSTSPPELPTPQRSATWDVASKPRVAPKPKQYVDAATSPGIQSPTELPVVTPGTDSDVLVNTPNIRARMAQLQQSSQTHAPPVTASKLPLERRSSRVSLDKKAEERAQSAERLEAKTKSEARTSVPSKATAAREGPSEPSRNPYAASRDEKDDSPRVPEGLSAALLSQRSGQVRLTKRPTQSAHLEKPWEKEAAAARQRQGQVMVGADATPESETADEPFAGVNALINRWQSRNS